MKYLPKYLSARIVSLILAISLGLVAAPSHAMRGRAPKPQPAMSWSIPMKVAALAAASFMAYRAASYLMTPSYKDEIDYENSIIVHQRQYATASCTEETRSKLTTYHINGCHFVILHDAAKLFAIGVHWDDETKKSEISRVVKEITEKEGIEINNLRAYFVGGWRTNSHYIYSEHFGDHLYNSLLKLGIKKENIDTRHMYEKATPNMSPMQFLYAGKQMDPAYFFMGVSFDACTGELLLSDTHLPQKELQYMSPLPGQEAGCSEYQMNIPGSGCPLKRSLPL